MNVFMTGATGYIGGYVARKLREHGHDVTALVRASSDHAALSDRGIATITGDLGDLGRMRDTITAHDVFIHTAISSHDTVALDREAVEAFVAASGRDSHFIYTSSVWVLAAAAGMSDEESDAAPLSISTWRAEHEQLVLDAAGSGIKTTILRPGCVYGGPQGLLRECFSAAFRGDTISVAGEGDNRWALVHVCDLADLYLRAIETRTGGVLHGTDDSNLPMLELAHSVASSARRSSNVVVLPEQEAREQLGPIAEGWLADQQVSSERTRERVGWMPRHTSFTESLPSQWREWQSHINGEAA